MKINYFEMLFDNNYKYEIISETTFNNKYLSCKSDGSKYKKYILIFYKKDNEIKYIDIPDDSYLNRFDNIIKIYNVEEIISSCINFDSEYDKLNYFHINDIYFTKYLIDEDMIEILKLGNDYEKIKEYFDIR
jgi:hypothetical protein